MEKKSTQWTTLSVEEVFSHLATQPSGLTEATAQDRLKTVGYNTFPAAPPCPWPLRLLRQIHNVLIYVLIIAAVIILFLGRFVDASVIFVVVLVNTMIGFIQEGKAERAIEAVHHLLPIQATVIRDHRRLTIPASHLVPGDIVILQSGDQVPADCRLFQAKNLQMNESLLTGESVPVNKSIDHDNLVFSGTLVTYGKGTAIVVETGEQTQMGHISKLLTKIQPLTTPLLQKMAVLARWLTAFILVVAGSLFLYGILVHHYSMEDMFIATVSIAVAAIPEGLPVILTITLAIGVQRMAKRHAAIRRLPAVETLGSVTIICSDKTGTLTRNEMSVQTVCLATGTFINDFPSHPDLLELCQAAILCNEADLGVGDPTESALIMLANQLNLNHHKVRQLFPMTDIIPFESEHLFMASLHHDHMGHGFIYIKGAPEVILQRCCFQLKEGTAQPIHLDEWHQTVQQLASRGQRTLAIAFKPTTATQQTLHRQDVGAKLILLGIVGITDPPRKEAMTAIAQCQSANIRVKMITGDHAITAHAIANELGIHNNGDVLTGDELDRMDEQTFQQVIDDIHVFARTNPEHKLRLVKALQAKGYIVAMTGDGVNDAPALKQANIGVAMGEKGTEVAKEASEMVIMDDNFASIVDAVKEGRTVYDNLKKAISFFLPINGGESFSLIIAILFGYTLPITPVQILWVNMVSSVTLVMSLAFEPSEPDIMKRSPTPIDEPLLSKRLFWRVILISTVFVGGIFGIFIWGLSHGTSLETARTLAINTLVVLEVFYLFSARYMHGSSFTWRGIRGTKAIFIAITIVFFLQLFFTYFPAMNHIFQTQPLNLTQCLWVGLMGILGFMIIEAEKLIVLNYNSRG